jgi:hypothetical protein
MVDATTMVAAIPACRVDDNAFTVRVGVGGYTDAVSIDGGTLDYEVTDCPSTA